MKATGIVRRIDDLGRVVIPKEIRRTMRIREGDPLLMTLARKTLSGRCFALWTLPVTSLFYSIVSTMPQNYCRSHLKVLQKSP